MIEVDGKQIEKLSISVTVKKVTTEIAIVHVPVDEKTIGKNWLGKDKMDPKKVFDQAIELAKIGTLNEGWKSEKTDILINETQLSEL